jgi:hypothetical protein
MRLGPRALMVLFAAFLIAVSVHHVALWAQEERPLSKGQITDLLRSGDTNKRMETLIHQRGIDFEPAEDDFQAAPGQYRQGSQLNPQDEAIRANLERVSRRLQRPSLLKK